jgi:DNA-binding ferritin-like protein
MPEAEDKTERPERDVEQLADELDSVAERLEKHGDEVDGSIDKAREDWDRKRADESVAGATPPDSGAAAGSS